MGRSINRHSASDPRRPTTAGRANGVGYGADEVTA